MVTAQSKRRWVSFVSIPVAAGVIAVIFAGATLPTPLYPLYRQVFRFDEITLTLVFAVYVVGNLAALLLLGRLSDQVGRRPIIWLALGVGLASTVAFAAAQSVAWLFVARTLSGLATGLGAGATTAWITELMPRRDNATAASLAAIANFIGIALGPLMSGVLAAIAPWPLHLSYIVYLAILLMTGLAVAAAPETVENRVRRLGELSLRPRIGVPRHIRVAFAAPALSGFVTFALIGFYAALVPNLLAERLQQRSPAVAGAVAFELFMVAAVVVVATRRLSARGAMLSALVLLLPSLALIVLAEITQSLTLLVGATAIVGAAAALGYRGSLEVANALAPDDKRGEVVSSYMIALYLGNSLPVIGIGVLTSLAGMLLAHIVFAIAIGLAAAGALWVGWRETQPRDEDKARRRVAATPVSRRAVYCLYPQDLASGPLPGCTIACNYRCSGRLWVAGRLRKR
jgi:MFS family permease